MLFKVTHKKLFNLNAMFIFHATFLCSLIY